VIALFLIIFLGAYNASKNFRLKASSDLLSNGTSLFGPTTILISLDGFRADYLNRGLTPILNSFIAEGVSPQYMLPSFPSVTFPNHFTLVTGLYPESHGVVGNTFWDPKMKAEFYYTDPDRSMQPEWWQAEPLWVTAEHQGVRTAIHMWPGSEAHIPDIEPTYVDKWNRSETLPRKVERVLGLLDLAGDHDVESSAVKDRRPQFIAYYVPNVDSDGHKYGPNSTEIRKTISDVDTMLGHLFAGLRQRNLTDIVNVVIVSDHGMATTSTDRLIQLEDLVDLDLVDHVDGWPLQGLRPKDPNDVGKLHEQLMTTSASNPNIEVYLRDKDMPERWHFSNNDRIAPLWIIPKAGWAIATKEDFDVEKGKKEGKVYLPRGLHGYDHEHPLMRAIFVARGPSFPHKPNSRVPIFRKLSTSIMKLSLAIAYQVRKHGGV
jgi:predicted AlkP superfamily pyrophosphatase or phosphodiesterase